MNQRRDADDSTDMSLVARSPSVIQKQRMTDEDWELIQNRFGDPSAVASKEDYYTFRMIASGDGLDSYYTKQDAETSFPNFVDDLKRGQALLGNHSMATFAYGSSFDGITIPADPSRSEYEPTFYPRWDRPELRTQNWLVGKYFIPRGIELNGQKTDDLIRGIELGSQRKASISFVVGRYVCGVDGRDLIQSWLGPVPDEQCNHFPGVEYDGQIAWASMKDNVLLETSLVYKNASPSSMLLRKAESMASRGVFANSDLIKLEERFQVRLPAFERRLWAVPSDITQEDNMAKRSGSTDATRDLVREALTTENEDPQTDTLVTDEAPVVSESPEATAETVVAADVADETPAADAAVSEAVTEETPADDEASLVAAVEAGEPISEPETVSESAPEQEIEEPIVREEDVVSEFIAISERFSDALMRKPEAFNSAQLSAAARAEKNIDLALIDAGCDTTVGSHVARTFETRSKAVRDTLGEPITVEAIRSLQQRATLGDTLFDELVKDTVAARTGVQGESFDATGYREVLLSTRNVSYVKSEKESWTAGKSERFTPGRQTVAPPPPASQTTKEERQNLPTRPTGKVQSNGAGNILAPRSK